MSLQGSGVEMLYLFFLLLINNIKAMDPLTKDLLTPAASLGEKCGYESCPNIKEGWTNIHIVAHSHAELGYMKTFHEHFTGYDDFFDKSNINMKRILDAVISELWADKKRKFTLSNSEFPYFFHWWTKRDATVYRMVYELIRQGRLVFVGGGWGMADEATTYYQSVIDSYTYSLRRITSSFLSCVRPLVAWKADVFGHSREHTSLIAQMGFDGLFINPISFDDELIRMDRRALEFVWRGSDDLGPETDIYTHKLFDGYWSPPGFCFGSMCSDPLLITSDSVFRNIDERVEIFIDSIKNRQAPFYNTKHVMVIMGQRMGYFNAHIWFENIDTLITNVNIKTYKDNLKMHAMYSNPACYLKAVQEENPPLETKQDDFFPFAYNKYSYASGMYTSRPTFKYFVRQANIYLQIAKQLQVLTNMGKNNKIIDEFMWIMGIVQDHNILSGAMRPYVHSYYTERLYVAMQKANSLIGKAFNKIRKMPSKTEYHQCPLNISSCEYTEKNKFNVLVYNPLAWPVTMAIRLPISNKKYNVFDPSGTKMKAVIMKSQDHILDIPNRGSTNHELVFIAKIPPVGFITFHINEQTPRKKRSLIKKINKTQQQKYFIRQVNSNRTIFEDEYDDFDTVVPEKTDYNVSQSEINNDYNYVVTPRRRVTTTSTESVTDTVILDTENTENDNENNTAVVESDTENAFNFLVNDTEITTETINDTISNVTENNIEDTNVVIVNDTLDTNITEFDTEDIDVLNATEKYIEVTTIVIINDIDNSTVTIKDESTVLKSSIKNDTDFKNGTILTERPDSYYFEESNDTFIRNKYVQVNLDDYRKISSLNLSNGIKTNLDIQYYYYISDEGNLNDSKIAPGAYIFRALDSNPEPIIEYIDTKVYKSDVVEEIHSKYSDYASFNIKLYVDSPVLEVDWVVGPVPFEDNITYKDDDQLHFLSIKSFTDLDTGLGKEVFIRYTTDLNNDGVFYTDANGRQMMKRIRNVRPMYEPYRIDHIAGNFYPVTSRIYIEDLDKNLRFSVFNDRSQGGSSILDGAVDLMVHRRIFTDDSNVQTYLNETEYGMGVIVRGTHYLYLTKADFKQNRLFEKKFGKEIEMQPQVFISEVKSTHNFETALKAKLPFGVHLLSLEFYNDFILLRLENYLEKVDLVRSGVKKVYLKDIFVNIQIIGITETTLSGHMAMKDWVPLKWNVNGSFYKSFNDFYGSSHFEYSKDDKLEEVKDFEDSVTLGAQQIKTFLIKYQYKDN